MKNKVIFLFLNFLYLTSYSQDIFKNPDVRLNANMFSPFISVDNTGFAGINLGGIVSQRLGTSNFSMGTGLELSTPNYIETQVTEFVIVMPVELNYQLKYFIPFVSIGPSFNFEELLLSSKAGLKYIIRETYKTDIEVYLSINYLYIQEANCIQFGIGILLH